MCGQRQIPLGIFGGGFWDTLTFISDAGVPGSVVSDVRVRQHISRVKSVRSRRPQQVMLAKRARLAPSSHCAQRR
jgi:hypothetical protein